jgi:hypothetical protein
MASKIGLLSRLRRIEALPNIPDSVEERIELAKSFTRG